MKKTNYLPKFSLAIVIFFGLFITLKNNSITFISKAFSEDKKTTNTSDLGYVDQDFQFFTNAHQITFDGPKSGEGYFNHDGTKMIFQSERVKDNPFYQMFLLDLKTKQIQQISTGVGKTTCGWVHPSDQKVMWSSTHLDPEFKQKVKKEYEDRAKPVKGRYSWSFDDQYEIFESDLKGQHIKQLTHAKGYDAEGSYSPDGKLIAFASNRTAYDHTLTPEEEKHFQQDASYFMEIYIMNADGSNVRRLTNTPGYDGGPFFSADGKKITWRRFSESGATAEIMTMNVDGSDQKQITHLNSMSWAPFYHPSGDYIIFASPVGGYSNFELFIVDSEGKNKPVRVTNLEGFDGLASFSPDGQTLTWSHRNEKGESQIYVADWNHEKALSALGIKSSHPTELFASTLQSDLNVADVKKIVTYLAQPAFKGRYTGEPSEIIYSNKIAELFKTWGLKPFKNKNYIQEFEFISDIEAGEKNKAEFQGRYSQKLVRGEDYQLVSYSKSGEFNSAPVVFAGFGIKAPANAENSGYDSYRNLDINQKWVVILDESPKPSARDFNKHTYLLSFSRLQHKITVAKNNGAYGVIVVTEQSLKDLKYSGSLSDSQLPIVKISQNVFWNLIKQSDFKTLYGQSFTKVKDFLSFFDTYEPPVGFQVASTYFSSVIDLKYKKAKGHNVVAVLYPQQSSKQNQKALLIGAHGDHLGYGLTGSSLATGDQKGLIHPGADDNASGVSGVLELAHYFSTQKNKLQKPLVFAVWSGEEIGLLGSTAFTKQFNEKKEVAVKTKKAKAASTESAVARIFEGYLNMDMIGQLKQQLYVQGVGSANAFKDISERAALKNSVSLNLSQDPYLPTDSMAFYLAGIPAITFFTGSHLAYHTPADKAETLNYDGLVKVVNVVKDFTEDIALKPNSTKLVYEKVEGSANQKLEGRSFHVYLGTIPDYTQEGVSGVRITGTSKNSPAEIAGLLAGDIIIELDKTKIENIYDYVYLLQSLKPDIEVLMKVKRKDEVKELKITPKLKN